MSIQDAKHTGYEAIRVNNQPIPKDEADKMIRALDTIIADSFSGHGKSRHSSLGEVTLSRVRLMTSSLRLRCALDCGLKKASELAAVSVGRGVWAARQTRRWIRHFQTTNELPKNIYGIWNGSVIEDEDFSEAIREHLRTKGKYVKAGDIIDFFGTPDANKFSHLLTKPPCLRTAQRWMEKMGYTWMKERRGQFADGHERDDVVEYRMKHYVPEWIKMERRMRSWIDGQEIPPELKEGERVLVVWFHDESTFYAHDRRLTRWVHEGETSAIYKKGEGISIMVADFVSADYGWLRLSSEPENEIDEEDLKFVSIHVAGATHSPSISFDPGMPE